MGVTAGVALCAFRVNPTHGLTPSLGAGDCLPPLRSACVV